MTESTETRTESNDEETNWDVEYDVEPIRMRDPVAEALAVTEPGEPLVFTYLDVVKIAGHSCPTASGAFRIAQLGLDALYPDADELPVRSGVEVFAGGPRDDSTYGVTSRLISYVTGAAAEDGFAGLGGGYGGRRNDLYFGEFDTADVAFEFRRKDTGDAVRVTYHVAQVPESGPAVANLRKLIEGSATDEEREAFSTEWHGRIQAVLSDDDLFTVESIDSLHPSVQDA